MGIDNDYRGVTIDPIKVTSDYLSKASWRVKENSTSAYSIGGLVIHQASTSASQYWLKEVYTPEIATAHKHCALHLHDLQMNAPYCFDKDTEFVLADGTTTTFGEAEGKTLEVKSINKETNEVEIKKAFDIGCKGNDDLYEMELEDGTIISGFTKWHEFLTTDGRYVSAENLTEDDELVVC